MPLSDQIRKIAKAFVDSALRSGKQEFCIAVKDLMNLAKAQGISTVQRAPAFCTSIQTKEFLEGNGLEVVGVDGPASKRSTTVIVHYRFRDLHAGLGASPDQGTPIGLREDPLLELSGVLRGSIREGAAAFLRELRRDKEPGSMDSENVA